MTTHKFRETEERLKQLLQPQRNQDKRFSILAGHYPLERDGRPADPLSEGTFGVFPELTFELGSRLIKFAKDFGTFAQLYLLVDDHSQQRVPSWYLNPNRGNSRDIEGRTREYFDSFFLPPEFLETLEKHDLSEDDFIRNKEGGVWHRESSLRRRYHQETGLTPGCAGEYRLALEEIANRGFTDQISLIPSVCRVPTSKAISSYAAVESNPELSVTHVYLATGIDIQSVEDLEDRGIIVQP